MGGVKPAGNAISASTADWFSTPIKMPLKSTVYIECKFSMIDFAANYNFFDFTEGSSFVGKSSSANTIRYRVTSQAFYATCTLGNQNVRTTVTSVQLQPFSGTGTITVVNDGTTLTNSRSSWIARTQGLRMHLAPNFYVKRLTQTNDGGILVHDLTPAVKNGVVGMYDSVDGTFYDYPGGNAYIATI